MTSKIQVPDMIAFLANRGATFSVAVKAFRDVTLHGTTAVQLGLITYEFAEMFNDTGVTGFDVRVLNVLV